MVELGCGLGLPSIAAALAGGRVLATDWAPESLAATAANAERNGARVDTLCVDWRSPAPLLERAPFDLAIAADVLYEARNVPALLALLPHLAPEAWIAAPGRATAAPFWKDAACEWEILVRPPVWRMRRRRAPA